MSGLRLVSPLRTGDLVRVPEPVTTPSGRKVRRGTYEVLAPRGRAVVVAWRPDCSALGGRFNEADSPARDATAVTLYPGEFTAYAGDGPAYIHDR